MKQRLGVMLAVGWLCVAAMAAAARGETYGQLTIQAEAPPYASTNHGYAEYRVTLTNRSPDRGHSVTLTLPKENESWGDDHIRSITRHIEVPPASTVQVSLFQPPLPVYGSQIAVTIDGRRAEAGVTLTPCGHGDRYSVGTRAILFSRQVSGTLRDRIQNIIEEEEKLNPYASSPQYELLRSERDAQQWSEHWLAHTRYDALVLTGSELAAMPGPAAAAVWAYVETGGTLILIGEAEVPEPWRAYAAHQSPPATQAQVYHVGFGTCWIVPGAVANNWGKDAWESLTKHLDRAANALRPPDLEDAIRQFPVVDDLSIPVRGLLGMMVLFALLIGPVNLVVLSRMKRRLWVLWTVPAMSLVFSVAVFGYSVLAEGWDAAGRVGGVTLLDQRTHRAATLAWLAYYSPLTPREGLHFDHTTELTPVVNSFYYSRSSSAPRFMDWTRDQHLAAGWVSARVPAYFAARKIETRRERLTLQRGEDGSLTVVNGLGGDIEALSLADEQGRVWTAQHVPAGAKAVLSPTSMRASADRDLLRELFLTNNRLHVVRQLETGGGSVLLPNSYVARMRDCPFIEPGMPTTAGRLVEAVVYGLMEEPPHAD